MFPFGYSIQLRSIFVGLFAPTRRNCPAISSEQSGLRRGDRRTAGWGRDRGGIHKRRQVMISRTSPLKRGTVSWSCCKWLFFRRISSFQEQGLFCMIIFSLLKGGHLPNRESQIRSSSTATEMAPLARDAKYSNIPLLFTLLYTCSDYFCMFPRYFSITETLFS